MYWIVVVAFSMVAAVGGPLPFDLDRCYAFAHKMHERMKLDAKPAARLQVLCWWGAKPDLGDVWPEY